MWCNQKMKVAIRAEKVAYKPRRQKQCRTFFASAVRRVEFGPQPSLVHYFLCLNRILHLLPPPQGYFYAIIRHTESRLWTVCAQPDGSMSSLLQSTGSSPYVLVHIVGPLAATPSIHVSEQQMKLQLQILMLEESVHGCIVSVTWQLRALLRLRVCLFEALGACISLSFYWNPFSCLFLFDTSASHVKHTTRCSRSLPHNFGQHHHADQSRHQHHRPITNHILPQATFPKRALKSPKWIVLVLTLRRAPRISWRHNTQVMVGLCLLVLRCNELT